MPSGIQIQRYIALFCLLFVTFGAGAELRMDDSRTWRRAKLITSGQQVWSFQSSYQSSSERFSGDGTIEAAGNQYSRTLTWRQLSQADVGGQANVQAYMNQNNLSGNEVAATSTYEVDQKDLGFGFNWAYGLTSRWMVGLQVPITLRTVRVRQVVEMTPLLAQGAGQAAGSKAVLALNAKDLHNKVKQLAEEQLNSSGYDHVPEQKQTWDFGDVTLLSQVALAQTYHWSWSTQQQVRFPTAQNSSMADYIQTSQGEGAVNLGLSSLLDYQQRRWLFGSRVGYVKQMPDSTRIRVPSKDSSGQAQVDPKVRRSLGDWVWTSLDAEYQVTQDLVFDLAYSYFTKGKDHYSGDSVSNADYARLAENTDQQIHLSRVGLFYRLGNETSRNGISNKWIAALDYNYPWVGKNSSDAARTSLELINYF